MVQIKSIGVIQTSKIVAVLMAILVSPCAIAMAVLITILEPDQRFPVAFFFILPFFYALAGFFVTAFMCYIYNRIAGWIGGIEIELQGTGTEVRS